VFIVRFVENPSNLVHYARNVIECRDCRS